MNVGQKKVVVLDFTVLGSKPKPVDVQKFVARDLKVQRQQLKCVQMLTTGKTLLEFYDPAAAKIATSTNMRHSMQCDGKLIPIPVYFKEDTVEVKIYDLSPEVPAEKIAKSISRFGKILSLERDKWRKVFVGIDNGVYLLRMQLIHHIPKRLTIDGHASTILYTGQPRNQLKRKRKKHINNNNSSNENNDYNNIYNNKNNNNQILDDSDQKEEQPDPGMDQDGDNTSQDNQQHQQQENNNASNENGSENEDEEFEVVISKRRRKSLNRQCPRDSVDEGKLPMFQKTKLFAKRYQEAKRKYLEAVDMVSRQHQIRLQMLYSEKFTECYQNLKKTRKATICLKCSKGNG
uniref:Uncharacterized protein n=1 Tax=Culex tarsalis TaxID=7177 RepID=A0A1Q3FQ95_CULTA